MNKNLPTIMKFLTVFVLVMVLATLASSTAAQPTSVTLVGDLQQALGCEINWDPPCVPTMLAEQGYGVWRGEFAVPAGSWNYKMALDGTWDASYPSTDKPLTVTDEPLVRFY